MNGWTVSVPGDDITLLCMFCDVVDWVDNISGGSWKVDWVTVVGCISVKILAATFCDVVEWTLKDEEGLFWVNSETRKKKAGLVEVDTILVVMQCKIYIMILSTMMYLCILPCAVIPFILGISFIFLTT